MACHDQQIAIMLPDYCLGRLDEQQQATVQRHLTDCDECRESRRIIMALINNKIDTSPGASPHLSTEEVIRYYLHTDRLTADERDRMSAHLQSCDECAHELAYLREVEGSLQNIAANQRATSQTVQTDPPATWSRQTIVAYLALAATLVLLIVTTAGDPKPPQPIAATGSLDLYEQQRSSTTIPVLERVSGLTSLNVILHHAYDTAGAAYYMAFEHVDSDSTIAVAHNVSFESDERIQSQFDILGWPGGRYLVRLVRKARATPMDSTVTRFPFRLIQPQDN
ncbi:MAG: hypothetical protein GF341_12020 [candidate division Zixibacteria bacterium]|nr:hypothetical protein [candidate division Zixibacteria bacterium]